MPNDAEYLSSAEYDARMLEEWWAADPRYRGKPPESCVIDVYEYAHQNPAALKLINFNFVALAQVHVKSYMREGHRVRAYVREGEKHWNDLPGIEDLLKPVHGGNVIRATEAERKAAAKQRAASRKAFMRRSGALTYKPRSAIEQTTVHQLRNSFAKGILHTDPIGDSGAARLTFDDGVEAITRAHQDRYGAVNIDPATSEDVLSQIVGDAVGAPIAHGFVDSKGDLITELVPGEMAYLYADREGENAAVKLLTSPEGHALGLFDYVTTQGDRHGANWLITPEGHVVGIDHSLSWYTRGQQGRSSPFTLANSGTYTAGEIKDYMVKIRALLDGLKPITTGQKLSSAGFYGDALKRLQYMLDHNGAYDPDFIEASRMSQDARGKWKFVNGV